MDRYGHWFLTDKSREGRRIVKGLRLATDAEVLERLSAYATSIGIKAGATIINSNGYNYVLPDNKEGFVYRGNVNTLYFNSYQVMKDGKWATIVEQPKTIEDRLEAIEKHLNL